MKKKERKRDLISNKNSFAKPNAAHEKIKLNKHERNLIAKPNTAYVEVRPNLHCQMDTERN
jgi:hypothetical protein